MHDLTAVLLLRLLPDTERLILVGDEKQLAPHVARQEAVSVLDRAAAIIPSSSYQPQATNPSFVAARWMLDTSYRMPRQLCSMVSQLFYDGQLKSAKADDSRCVWWHDVVGPTKQRGSSRFSPTETTQLAQLHASFMKRGYSNDDIVIICMYEAQRKHVSDKHSNAFRVFNVDSFQGQEVR